MTDSNGARSGASSEAREQEEAAGRGPVIRDKRRIDPQTGERRPDEGSAQGSAGQGSGPDDAQPEPAEASGAESDSAFGGAVGDALPGGSRDEGGEHPDTALAAERLEEMRRMQAEFVNFRNRTQREREADRTRSTGAVVEALLPVMDDIHSAREHGDLTEGSPFAAIADKLEQALGRFGVERTGTVGEPFDPTVHEALMHLPAEQSPVELPEGTTEMTVVQVIQPGFRVGEHVVRAARVAVADPS